MSSLRRWVKRLAERVTGFEIERHGSSVFSLVPAAHRTEAWFSYRTVVSGLLQEQQIDLVLDAGANAGQFASRLRREYAGEIVSFEPAAAAFARLQAAAAGDDRWQTRQVALGRTTSTLTMHVASDSVFSSALQPNDYSRAHFRGGSAVTHEEVVPVRRVEDVVRDTVKDAAKRRVFLKIDTQGYDLEVFGGVGTLLDNVLVLQSEVSLIPIYEGMPHWTESIAIYEQAGFGVVGMFPVAYDGRRVLEYDCLMTRVES